MATQKWYKGNIHTHTTESDGDESPEKVVGWYRRHGYDFLVLSDHNHLTLLEYGAGKRKFKRPIMIPGEEVSINIKQGTVPVHINGIGITRIVEPVDAGEVVPTLQANINLILEAGGIASINHPNFKWAFDHEAIQQVNGASLLEVFNGHPGVNVYGAPDRPDYEEIWDRVLSSGKVIFGVATDDSHNYKDFVPDKSNPGRGWLMVRSSEASSPAIVDALGRGDFYASTGVELEELEISGDAISLRAKQWRDMEYVTRFIGRDGAVHSEVVGTEASYRIRGNEGHVRATVRSSSGPKAWVQPVFVG
jgi:hypothetical protein